MTSFAFPPPEPVTLPIEGTPDRYPIHRIYCVGRNYAAHAREMGADPDREPPFFFTKPADAIVESGATIEFPPATAELHHEIELVVALGQGGRSIPVASALEHVFGYAVGLDLTRRDLQAEAKKRGRPWDTAKGFARSAPCSAIQSGDRVGPLERGRIWLEVNGELRQQGDLADLIWSIPEMIHLLSELFELEPGDLLYSGTPAGVGPLQRGDRVHGGVERVGTIDLTLT